LFVRPNFSKEKKTEKDIKMQNRLSRKKYEDEKKVNKYVQKFQTLNSKQLNPN